MLTLQDIQSQLASLFSGGQYQGDGATTFAAPNTTGAPSVSGTNASFTPNFGNGAATAGSTGFGTNMPTAGLALGGLQALGGFLQGQKATKLAQDQFKFQKSMANTNLNNQVKSYNTALEDRLNARGAMQGDSADVTAANIEKNRLSR